MRIATSDQVLSQAVQTRGLKILRECGIRPAVGFIDSLDLLKDPHLTAADKREILLSWASDASAVQDEPTLRWLLGTPEPVPLLTILDALEHLDRSTSL